MSGTDNREATDACSLSGSLQTGSEACFLWEEILVAAVLFKTEIRIEFQDSLRCQKLDRSSIGSLQPGMCIAQLLNMVTGRGSIVL